MENQTTSGKKNSKSNTIRTVPGADIDFGKVVTSVAATWAVKPDITLNWVTSAEFTTDATAYNTALMSRKEVGGSRPQITKALKTLDNEINDALLYVKGYIIDKYKKDAAPSYYKAFGIEHKENRYTFPTDQNNRLAALDLMLKGILANGFGSKEYGTAFWTPIKTQYATLLNQAIETDGTISTKVNSKNVLKKTLKKTMNSLIMVIKGNYPDTYKAELRAWGFQKEKY